MWKLIVAVVGLLATSISSSSDVYQRYDNFKVVRVVPATLQHMDVVKSIKVSMENGQFSTIDFWKEPSTLNSSVDIMVHPKDVEALTRFFQTHKLHCNVVIQDVQQLIDHQKLLVDNTKPFPRDGDHRSFTLDEFHSTEDINNWMDSLAKANPDVVSVSSIGKTFEGRETRVIKIGIAGSNKPGYWIDAGIHAREWISVSTAVYVINELVSKYQSNPTYKNLLETFDFHILPVTNPDGYEYSRTKDRNWRKTRSGPHGVLGCKGVDPNRNFDFHWGESGTSSNACAEDYGGPNPFSEVECSNLAKYLKSLPNLKAYMTLHTYGDLFMYSYGYADHTYPPDVDELKAAGKEAAAAIKSVHGTVFKVGSPTDILYPASGASDDYSKGVLNIKYVYTLELRPGDDDPDAQYGFNLPAKYITPVGEEVWTGLQSIANRIASRQHVEKIRRH